MAADAMTERQRYRFDLDGYLVLEDALEPEAVDELNRLVDAQELPAPSASTGSGRRFREYLEWGQASVDLLDHERVFPILREVLGETLRLDHYYGIYMERGGETLTLHGGGTPYDPSQYYHNRHGQPYCGFTVVVWNLTRAGPDAGGFCCIPGSHRANYACPPAVDEETLAAPHPADLPDEVVVPEASAGSAIVFTEALTHGTAPWVADHQRRSLLNKYSPGHQSWASRYLEVPAGVELTSRQERLFQPPSIYEHEPVVSADD